MNDNVADERMNRINTNGYPVFTTYSLQDQEKVRYIVEMMTSILGIRVFDPENDVQPGESIIRKIIENGIEKSKASVLFISKNFLKSGLCKFIADNILWRYIITKGKYRVIPIVLDKCKVPRSFRVLNCIYCWKYELKVQKYNATVLDCLVQLKRRFIKALKGPRLVFRRLKDVKTSTHGKHILWHLRSIMKRDRILREKKNSPTIFGLWRLVNVSKHCILTCKYGDCTFSCSGENFKKLEKHIGECLYVPLQCPNRFCLFRARKFVMKKHLENCKHFIEKCPIERCNVKKQRQNMASHMRKCPNRLVPCENKLSGCPAVVPFKELQNHIRDCSWSPKHCKNCGNVFLRKESGEHACPLAIIECPDCGAGVARKDMERHHKKCHTKCCSMCNETFAKNHRCLLRKCQFDFCDYKDTHLRVEEHMTKCKYKPVVCKHCGMFVPSKNFKIHQGECKNIVVCRKCGIRVQRSCLVVHERLLCTANRNRPSCLLCERLVNLEGLINTKEDMEVHHSMHQTPSIPNHIAESKSDEPKDTESLKTSHDEDDGRYTALYLDHINHSPRIDKNQQEKESSTFHRSGSHCTESRKRFDKILRLIELNQSDLERNGSYRRNKSAKQIPSRR